jgi:hypothetical protein
MVFPDPEEDLLPVIPSPWPAVRMHDGIASRGGY